MFTTDLLLLRMTLSSPLLHDTTDLMSLRIIEDSLYSAAEAIQQSACRHRELDINQSELGVGFRIVQAAGAIVVWSTSIFLTQRRVAPAIVKLRRVTSKTYSMRRLGF